jgi:branched-chain amino acid transport system ATP-binding protein
VTRGWSTLISGGPELLEVAGLAAGYLGERVIDGIDVEVRTGEAVAIVGSNGAGKTTLFRAIAGLRPPMEGRVVLDGEDLTRRPAHRISRAGIAYVPAERHLFPAMTVKSNLVLGAYPSRPDRETLELVYDLFPRLRERHRQQAGTLSGGEQQMLAVGRALMARPRLLMLDEPTTGLAPKVAEGAFEALEGLKKGGMTLLIAEQQVPLALSVADRGYVLENGRIRLEGTSDELAHNPEVRRAYLGIA